MNELTPKNQYSIQYWLDIIHRCRESGLSNNQWCEENGISIKSYYYWLAKIRNMAVEDLPRKKHVVCQSESSVDFAEIHMETLPQNTFSANAPVIIRSGAFAIEVHHDADVSLIRSVLQAVSSC